MGCLGQRYLSSWAVAWPRSARFALACQNSVGRQLTARYAPDAAAARRVHLVDYGYLSPTASTAYAGSERSSECQRPAAARLPDTLSLREFAHSYSPGLCRRAVVVVT